MEELQTRKGISGSTLKLIAVITMVIDHVGAVVLARLIMASGYMSAIYSSDVTDLAEWLMTNENLYNAYTVTRFIGRMAFPIFCFLLVEGFMRTGNAKKYGLRLGVFALISEIPFDLALSSAVFEWTYQNVFFTLLIGFVTMMVLDYIERTQWQLFAKALLSGTILLAGACLAEVLGTDYGARGVLAILALYLFRRSRSWQLVAGCAAFLWEMPALIGFIPIAFYNGKRGMKLKYFFYAFYPVHLVILYLIAVVLGVGGYAAW